MTIFAISGGDGARRRAYYDVLSAVADADIAARCPCHQTEKYCVCAPLRLCVKMK